MTGKYLNITIFFDDIQKKEIVNALIVSELTILGIEDQDDCLNLYMREEDFDEALFKNIVDINIINYSISTINDINWNEEWEKNFEPVLIGNFVSILADFHEKIPGVEYEILITPKMSFGTGHHATTHMMVTMMREYNCAGRTVLDFGTGTGILAILAEKMGATSVTAIDNDDWSMDNALENIERNRCSKIRLVKADQFVTDSPVQFILANINRNVILDNMSAIASGVEENGTVLFSGILTEDLNEIEQSAAANKLVKLQAVEKNNWVCAAFKRTGRG